MKVDACVTALASSPNLSDAHEMNSDEIKANMKESPRRYTNPFLSDEENDELNLWNNQEHAHDSINEDNFATNLENEKFRSCNIPSESLEKTKELYIDKKVTECQLPGLMNGFHVVKDICVDDGLSLSHDENIEIDKNHHKLSCNPINVTITDTVNGDKHDDMIEDVDQQFTEAYGCVKEKPEGEEVEKSSQTVDISNVSKMEENIDMGLDIVKPDTHGSDNIRECIDEVLPDKQSAPNQDIGTAVNQLQRGGAESSFSMAVSVSGRMASAGSISHRSDGSNTSVRSFAFPILQTEWNSSPVRMVKVDKRRKRKHRGWWQALICCRF